MESDQDITTCATTTVITSSTAITSPISVYTSSDRNAVQVIQQTLNRPSSSAAQYLTQMYAAQQQHLMLQTAALQQPHLSSSPLQSLSSVQQSSVSGDRSSISTTQQSNVPQHTIHLSTSPPPPQIISRSQTSSTTSSSSITQKTMLLGSTSPTLSASQAQMYLRAQMLIFTPAATVAAVPSDIPIISSLPSSSCQSSAPQNLALRSQPMIEIPYTHTNPLKSSSHDQPLSICQKTALTSSKNNYSDSIKENNEKEDGPKSEPHCSVVTCTSNVHSMINPVSYSPVHQNLLVKHSTIPVHPDHPVLPQHQILQQQQVQHKHQIQTIPLHNLPSEASSSPHFAPTQSQRFLPSCSSNHSHNLSPLTTPPSPSTTFSHSVQPSVVVSPHPVHSPSQSPTIIIHPQAIIQPAASLIVQSTLPNRDTLHQPLQSTLPSAALLSLPTHLPPALSAETQAASLQHQSLVSPGQQMFSPVPQTQEPELQTTPPPTISSPHLPTSSPSQLQALPIQSMQEMAVQPEILTPGQVLMQNALLSEEELPAAEALVQLPFQTLPPPQTVAVNLHIQPAPVESPVVYQLENMCAEDSPAMQGDCIHIITQTPTLPTWSPTNPSVGIGEDVATDYPLQGLPSLASSVSASVIKSPVESSHVSIPASPLLLPAATTRSNSTLKPYSLPGLNKLPQAIVKPLILTHVIEGFVIQEGVEPFPVNRSSLLVEHAVKPLSPLGDRIMSIADIESDIQSSAKLPDNSTDTDMEDLTAEEGVDELECELLACQFCGKTDYPNKFLKSKRYCSLSCAKRYNSKTRKQLALLKSEQISRWSRKVEGSLGRHGRYTEGSAQDYFLTQFPAAYSCTEEALEDSHDDSSPVAMTAHPCRQSDREREQMMQLHHLRSPPCEPSTEPSLWTVEDVWAFIHALPGCHDIADDFRAQEIDGQALLLLKEDHLMNNLNIKLGPALKICAHINSLK